MTRRDLPRTRVEAARQSAGDARDQLAGCEHELHPALPAIVLLLVGAVEQLAGDCESLSRVLDQRTEQLV